MSFHRLLYRSEAYFAGTDADTQQAIAEIVARSSVKNETVGLTGALIFANGVFVQALEGPPKMVEQTFERICCDGRHRCLELLEFVHAENRTFSNWSMARVIVQHQVEKMITGVSLFDAPSAEDNMSAAEIISFMKSMLLNRVNTTPVNYSLMENLN